MFVSSLLTWQELCTVYFSMYNEHLPMRFVYWKRQNLLFKLLNGFVHFSMYKPKTLCFGSSLKGNIFILPHLLWFVKNFFLIFLKNFFLDSTTGSLADSLIILTYYFSFVNDFDSFFYQKSHLFTIGIKKYLFFLFSCKISTKNNGKIYAI